MKSYQVRARAKDYLTGGWKDFAIISLIYIVILVLVSTIPNLLNAPYIISLVLQNFINIILSYGLFSVFWNYSKGQDVKFYEFIVVGFKNIKRAIFIFFHTALRLFIPFIIMMISIIFAVSSLNGSLIYVATSSNSSLLLNAILIISIITTIISFILVISKSLNYVFGNLVGIQYPDLTEKECVLKCKEFMQGNRKKYLFLLISFSGWFFVGICTLLIGFIWIFPYLQMSFISFYEMIQTSKTEKNKKKKRKNK